MAVENIRGTASISQNEVNVKSFFEEIFGNAEARYYSAPNLLMN